MVFQIDQSGKIEQTNLDSVIALSNDKKYTVLLKKKDKRLLQQFFRSIGKPRIFIYSTFAALVVLVINESKPNVKVVIDTEYTGYNRMIKKLIIKFLSDLSYKKYTKLEFGFVGKSSRAHKLASEVSSHKRRVDRIVKAEEIIKLFYQKK